MTRLTDLPREQAQELLSKPMFCEEAGDWVTDKCKPDTQTISCGLITDEGENTGLFVRAKYRFSAKTKIKEFSFTVFKTEIGYTPRVYSLDVKSSPRRLPDHDIPHEQWGNERVKEVRDWAGWSFSDALNYFQEQTNIVFRPALLDPTSLNLRG